MAAGQKEHHFEQIPHETVKQVKGNITFALSVTFQNSCLP